MPVLAIKLSLTIQRWRWFFLHLTMDVIRYLKETDFLLPTWRNFQEVFQLLASCIFPLSFPSTSPKKSLTFPGHFAPYCFEMPQRMKIFVKCTFFCHRPLPPPCRRLACAATVRAATDTLCKPPVSWLPTPQTSPHSSPSQKPPSLSGPALLSPLLRSVLSARRLRPGCCCWWTERAARRQGRCFSAAPLSFAAPSSPSLLCCPLLSFDNHLASKSWNHVCCWPPNAQYSMWLFMQVRCIKQSTASGIICFHPLPAQSCCTLCCLHFPIKLQLPSILLLLSLSAAVAIYHRHLYTTTAAAWELH